MAPMMRLEMAQEVVKRLLSNQVPGHLNPFFPQQQMAQALASASAVKIDARSFLQQQFQFLEKQQRLWQNATRAFLGDTPETLIREAVGDKRFADPDWQGNPAFSYLKQAYLLNAEYLQQMVDALDFEDAKLGEQVRQAYTPPASDAATADARPARAVPVDDVILKALHDLVPFEGWFAEARARSDSAMMLLR